MPLERSHLQLFATLFVGRRNDYAWQRDNGRYVRASRPLTYDALRLHLQGVHTLGTYVIDEQGTCRAVVFDADSSDGLLQLSRVRSRLAADGVISYLEASRRGGHLWVLLASLVPASQLRRWLLPYCPDGVEFYPKQDEGKGYGSLIRLPLGVHQLTRRRYGFVCWQEGMLRPVARSVSASLSWLATMQRVKVLENTMLAPTWETLSETHTPSLAKSSSSSGPLPSSATIRAWCASQDVLRVIGRYVQLNRHGLGCCPFGEHHSDGRDSHPSFRAYMPRSATSSCWYCYAWQRGGNLFDFLMLYHNLDARSLWHRILTGEVF